VCRLNEVDTWKSSVLPAEIAGYESRDVLLTNYAVLQHGLWRYRVKSTLVWSTLLVGTNMDGSEELPLLVMGNVKSHKVFMWKTCHVNTAYLQWIRNKDKHSPGHPTYSSVKKYPYRISVIHNNSNPTAHGSKTSPQFWCNNSRRSWCIGWHGKQSIEHILSVEQKI